MLSRSIAAALHERPSTYRVARRTWELAMGTLPPRSVAGIPGRVHRADLMLDSGRDQIAITRYIEAGQTAVKLLDEASDGLGSASPLDLGCGHGRVARWLARRIQPDRITVTDLDSSAVSFCRAEFGVRGFVCSADPASLLATGGHDVVWMGSVISHLSRRAAGALLQAVRRISAPGAAVVVTQHHPAQLAGFIETMPWIARREAELQDQLEGDGWAYADYPHNPGYGLAFPTDQAMRGLVDAAGLHVREVRRAAWLEQDAWLLRG